MHTHNGPVLVGIILCYHWYWEQKVQLWTLDCQTALYPKKKYKPAVTEMDLLFRVSPKASYLLIVPPPKKTKQKKQQQKTTKPFLLVYQCSKQKENLLHFFFVLSPSLHYLFFCLFCCLHYHLQICAQLLVKYFHLPPFFPFLSCILAILISLCTDHLTPSKHSRIN